MPWLERANRELATCGQIRMPGGDSYSTLTAQEMQVAIAIAGGATSREAAAELILSRRTVEYHLQQVYRKLGIRSRAELAEQMPNNA